jgi:hypothetical protein
MYGNKPCDSAWIYKLPLELNELSATFDAAETYFGLGTKVPFQMSNRQTSNRQNLNAEFGGSAVHHHETACWHFSNASASCGRLFRRPTHSR